MTVRYAFNVPSQEDSVTHRSRFGLAFPWTILSTLGNRPGLGLGRFSQPLLLTSLPFETGPALVATSIVTHDHLLGFRTGNLNR
jgi:hypothetical protein